MSAVLLLILNIVVFSLLGGAWGWTAHKSKMLKILKELGDENREEFEIDKVESMKETDSDTKRVLREVEQLGRIKTTLDILKKL